MPEERPAEILVVDDSPDARALMTHVLRNLGYRVRVATDGAEALEEVRRSPPDALLLDVSMPGMDGIEVCRRLRADPATAAIPIVLVTASGDLYSRLEGFEAGADDYLVKPFEPRELAARLKAHLDLASTRSQLAELRGVFATLRLISHEFNNPLQSVVGGVDLLREARKGNPAVEEEALAMIAEGVERLAELARRLVTISEPCFKDSPIGPMLDIEASR